MSRLLKEVGRVKVSSSHLSSRNKVHLRQTSKTFPGQCGASLEPAICQLETVAVVQTRDVEGLSQDCGGDPVTAEVISERGSSVATSVTGLQSNILQIRSENI